MLMLEIYAGAVDRSFDFQVDENTAIRSIADEIGEMLGKKVRSPIRPDRQKFVLCSMDQKCILSSDRTLAMCGVVNGSRLMLV